MPKKIRRQQKGSIKSSNRPNADLAKLELCFRSEQLIHLTSVEATARLELTLSFQGEWINLSNIGNLWFKTIQKYDKLAGEEQTEWHDLMSFHKSELASSIIDDGDRSLKDELVLSEAFKALSYLPDGWCLFGGFLNRLFSGLPLVGSDLDVYYADFGNNQQLIETLQKLLKFLMLADIVTKFKMIDESTNVDLDNQYDMLPTRGLSRFRIKFTSGIKMDLLPKKPTGFDFDVNMLTFSFEHGLRLRGVPNTCTLNQFWVRILTGLYTKTARLVNRQPDRVTFEPFEQLDYVNGSTGREYILKMMMRSEKLKKKGFRVMDYSPPVSTKLKFCSIEQGVPTRGLMVRPNCGHHFSLGNLARFCGQTGPSCSLCPVCRQPLVFDLRSGK